MAAEVQSAPEKEERYDHRAKRTQAIPKHTLFGSVMERLDDDEVSSVRKINTKEVEKQDMLDRKARRDRYKPKLPSSMKGQIPGNKHV